MNLQQQFFQAWLLAACLFATVQAFAPNIPTPNDGVDSSMDAYEAALKIAAQSAASQTSSVPSPSYSDVSILQHIDEQHEAMEKYEAALKAALAASTSDASSTVDTKQDAQKASWGSLTEEIHDIIKVKEAKTGKAMSKETKDEVIATAIAGSVLGTAVGSPLLIGAVLGFTGTQLLQGQEGSKHLKSLGTASHEILSHAASQANTVREFLGSDEVKSASHKAMQAIQDGLQSEQLRGLKNRASQMVKNTLKSK